jgi:acetolactate synthase regulatory subunit
MDMFFTIVDVNKKKFKKILKNKLNKVRDCAKCHILALTIPNIG